MASRYSVFEYACICEWFATMCYNKSYVPYILDATRLKPWILAKTSWFKKTSTLSFSGSVWLRSIMRNSFEALQDKCWLDMLTRVNLSQYDPGWSPGSQLAMLLDPGSRIEQCQIITQKIPKRTYRVNIVPGCQNIRLLSFVVTNMISSSEKPLKSRQGTHSEAVTLKGIWPPQSFFFVFLQA